MKLYYAEDFEIHGKPVRSQSIWTRRSSSFTSTSARGKTGRPNSWPSIPTERFPYSIPANGPFGSRMRSCVTSRGSRAPICGPMTIVKSM